MSITPVFPTYRGPALPQSLDPRRPAHYFRLLKWMHFQPSKMKHYLWQADAELYPMLGPDAVVRSLRTPAYRNLYLTSFVLVSVLSTVLIAVLALAAGTTVNWNGLAFAVVGGVLFGLACVVGGGVVYGAAFGAMFGTTFGVVFGTTFSLVSGVLPAFVGGVAFSMAGGLAFGVALGLAFIMAFGMVFGVAAGVSFIVALSAALIGAYAVALALVGGGVVLVALILTSVVAVLAGATRLLPNAYQWWQAFFLARSHGEARQRLTRHPILWDEYSPWPLPGTVQLIRDCLDEDFDGSLALIARVAANPFQRWAMQRGLTDYLAAQYGRLAVIYRLAHLPALGEYLTIPSRRVQFKSFPSAGVVFLGELGQECVAASSEATVSTEYLIWRLTRRWRRHEPTALSRFCALLYDLLHDQMELATEDIGQIGLAERFESVYQGVRSFTYGVEVAESFVTLDSFLRADSIESLARSHESLAWADGLSGAALRPAVVESLKALGDVSREVSVYVRATSTGQKSAALNRAIGALNELYGYVQAKVLPPEQVLLARIVGLWQSTIAAEQGRLGEAALVEMAPAARREAGIAERTSSAWQRPARPFDNPYIVGDPVYPPLLVGRKDVFDRIAEVWTAKKNPDSIILYGHRRMGKSSILRNLDQVAPQGSVVVYGDMAGEASFVETTSDLLLGLADRIYTTTRRAFRDASLTEPDPDAYGSQARAQFHFNRLLEDVRDALGAGNLILALDEFEAIERAVEQQKVGGEIYQFLRSKTQEPWLALVFGGLHTLDEMSRDYQQPFYGSYENICVSYLGTKDAWRLIANPVEGFTLNYEPAAIERIIADTGGQPYLVQQICRDALDHLNHELFDLEMSREVCVILADVEAVLDDDFFRRGTVYFDGVWTQIPEPEQRAILKALARCEGACTAPELGASTGLNESLVSRWLLWAERHDILYRVDTERWAFHVPLMQRWIRTMA